MARGGFVSMSWPQSSGEFRLGDFQVQSGEIIRDARLVWKAHGTLAPERDNVVLYPCSYGAKHEDLEWLIGPDGILDPTRWFIVIPNMFSNGVSSGAADTTDISMRAGRSARTFTGKTCTSPHWARPILTLICATTGKRPSRAAAPPTAMPSSSPGTMAISAQTRSITVPSRGP